LAYITDLLKGTTEPLPDRISLERYVEESAFVTRYLSRVVKDKALVHPSANIKAIYQESAITYSVHRNYRGCWPAKNWRAKKMARLSAATLEVNEEQQAQLEAIVRKRTSPQRLVVRARIILLAIAGVGVHETMRRLGIGRTTVQIWRRRWREADQESVEGRLGDRPRSGAPARYTPQQVCAIVAIACERPEESDRPITHWTQRELADEAVKREIVSSVSQRAVGHFLMRCRNPRPPDVVREPLAQP
jgi:putative transposase